MGLGKTIATLALVNPCRTITLPEPKSDRPYASQTTLIVVPMSLLFQWKSEFEKCIITVAMFVVFIMVKTKKQT